MVKFIISIWACAIFSGLAQADQVLQPRKIVVERQVEVSKKVVVDEPAWDQNGLPVLRQTQQITLLGPSSCGGSEGYSESYGESALFLSYYSLRINNPEIYYDESCGDPDSARFGIMPVVGDSGFIVDLGNIPLESVTASFSVNACEPGAMSETAPIIAGHSYVVYRFSDLNTHDALSAVFALKVVSYKPGGPLTIQYRVQSYSVGSDLLKPYQADWERSMHNGVSRHE